MITPTPPSMTMGLVDDKSKVPESDSEGGDGRVPDADNSGELDAIAQGGDEKPVSSSYRVAGVCD